MRKLRYLSATPCHFTHNGIDYSFHKDEVYEVPVEVKFINTLVSLKKMEVLETLPAEKQQDSQTQNS